MRTALLSADVHFKVAREFVERDPGRVRRPGGDQVGHARPADRQDHPRRSWSKLLGDGATSARSPRSRRSGIMLVGLQGSGKTTTAAQARAACSRRQGYAPLLVAGRRLPPGRHRPARDAGRTGGRRLSSATAPRDDVPAHRRRRDAPRPPPSSSCDTLIFDTAGRLQIDERAHRRSSSGLKRDACSPTRSCSWPTARLGQEAVNVATHFRRGGCSITGVVLTKLDGDARGGAALSMKSVTGKPIKFVGVGEKLERLRAVPPRPHGLAHPRHGRRRLSLVEKAQETVDQKEARAHGGEAAQEPSSRSRTSSTRCARSRRLGSMEIGPRHAAGHERREDRRRRGEDR
ncbi:MAG: hypothetical protein MZV63_19575 [Marinilabiliales bacterium]|nr:hypothetical protein [Marinilabiliales bacterium]